MAQALEILHQRLEPAEHAASLDATEEGRMLVVDEGDAGRFAQQPEYFQEGVPLVRSFLERGVLLRLRRGVAGDAEQLRRDLRRRQDGIDDIGRDRASRHAVVPGRLVLGEGEPPGFLDRAQPQGAVGPGPREDHADRLMRAVAARERRNVSMGLCGAWDSPRGVS